MKDPDDGALLRHVPAHRVLDLASALSKGAIEMSVRLQHLEPDAREAVLDLVADQLSTLVHVWVDLAREAGPTRPATGAAPPSDDVGARPTGTVFLSGAVAPFTPEPSGAAGGTVHLVPGDRPAPPGGPWPTSVRPVSQEDRARRHEAQRLTRDDLTGVLNRQAGLSALGREVDRCRRSGERFVLGYLDVDGLRDVNETQGRRAGDELLRKVAAALRATLRSYDIVMRLGGDEFLFSLPGADITTAELRCKEFGVILAEEAPGTSASVGFGELHGNDTLDELISRAEIALSKSRRSRRRDR